MCFVQYFYDSAYVKENIELYLKNITQFHNAYTLLFAQKKYILRYHVFVSWRNRSQLHGSLCISIIDDRNRYDIGGKTSAMPPGGKTSLQIEPRQATVEWCYSLDAFATKTISVAAYQRDRSGGNVSTVRNCQKRPMKSRRATNGLLISRLTRNKQRSSEMGVAFRSHAIHGGGASDREFWN